VSWVRILSAITQSSDEMGVSVVPLAQKIMEVILRSGGLLGVPYESLSGLLYSLDNIVRIKNGTEAALINGNSNVNPSILLEYFMQYLIFDQMIVGADEVVFKTKQFMLSVAAGNAQASGSMSIKSPSTSFGYSDFSLYLYNLNRNMNAASKVGLICATVFR